MSNQTEQLTIDLVRIQNIRIAAVMLAYGFHEHTRERGDRPGHVAFKLMVPSGRREEFDEIMQQCRNDFRIPLPGGVREDGTRLPDLGDYEKAHAHVRDAIAEFNEFSRQTKKEREKNGRQDSREGAATD